jgi:peptidoglycan hydrolase CwlO-like protein
MARRLLAPLFLLLLLMTAASAQQTNELRESQARLQKIREEREQLQRELEALRSQIRDEAREAANLARQRAASEEALRELDYQADVINNQVDETNRELGATQLRLRQRTDALNERLRSIYKRGKLHSVRVLLSAESFGDVLHRYKYLQLIAQNDRAIVNEVARLEGHLARQEQQLRLNQSRLESLRLEKSHELRQLDILAGRQTRELRREHSTTPWRSTSMISATFPRRCAGYQSN